MKFTVVGAILVTTVHLILADLPEAEFEASKNHREQSILQTIEMPNSAGDKETSYLAESYPSGLASAYKSYKPYSHKKKFRKWSKGLFAKAVSSLGIFKIPGLKLVKLRKSMIRELERAKGHMITIPHRRRKAAARASDIHGNKPQKKTLHDLCEEHADSIYMLAHADESLAYQVESVRCVGSCHSTSLGITLGECVLKRKTMVVYILDQSNNFKPETVLAGCACECLTNFL